MINKKRSGRAEGRLLEILENSTLEVRVALYVRFFQHAVAACTRQCPTKNS